MLSMKDVVARGRRTAQRVNNLMWERRLNIATRGRVSVDFPDAGHYATVDYSLVFRVLRHLALRPSDVFVDIGSGRGRILCCAARYPVRQVIGVDLSAEFCEQARANAARARGLRSPVVVHNAVAQEFDYAECTACYLFSPFGPDTVGEVLTKIQQDRAGGPVRIAYVNPAYPEVFDKQAWLERYDFWDQHARGAEHAVAFYRSRH